MLRISEEEFARVFGEEKKPSRERNIRCSLDGKNFSSRLEAKRYSELVLLERAGVIKNLAMQVPFIIFEKDKFGGAIRYIADFVYMREGKNIIEDVKAFNKATGKHRVTELFRLKWRRMHALYSGTHSFVIWPEKDRVI
jgi:hypothetical protein